MLGRLVRERGAVLVAGVSVRALAQSAARAGHRVSAVDAFGDADLRAVANVVALRPEGATPYSARAAARASRSMDAAAVIYTSSFENDPPAIAELTAGRRLLGNQPDVVARVRQPVALMRAWRAVGFAVPHTRASAPPVHEAHVACRWLLKPRRSGGGRDVRRWHRAMGVGREVYLQEQIDGVIGSIAFVADGRKALPLGMSRQLVGCAAFGARGFRYCGSLVGAPEALFADGGQVFAIASALADAVTARFGLVGVNGIDFVARDGVPYPIEVNPRYSASMELIERAYGVSIFETHVAGCEGSLPVLDTTASTGIHGKAIVFARQAARIGDTAGWSRLERADIPHTGERIGRGRAICTVFASADDAARCIDALVERANAVTADVTAAPARPAHTSLILRRGAA